MNAITSDQLLVGSGIVFVFLSIVGRLVFPRIGLHQQLNLFARCCLAVVGVALLGAGLYRSEGLPLAMASKKGPFEGSIKIADGFFPGGWMGDYGDIKLGTGCSDAPGSGSGCVKISYSARRNQDQGWAGIYWLFPDKNWGNFPDGRDMRGAAKVVFWAKGKKGGERAEFKVGGVAGKYPDSIQPALSTGPVALSEKWQRFTLDLENRNLSHVVGGFCWTASAEQNPEGAVIYVADAQFVP